MTQKEALVLNYIKKSTVAGNIPSIREICKNTEIASTSTVWGILKSLEKQGYINVTRDQSRGIQLAGFDVSIVPLLTKSMKIQDAVNYVPFPQNGADGVFAVCAKEDVGEIKAGDIVYFSPCYVAPDSALGAFETDCGVTVSKVGETQGALFGRMIGFTRLFNTDKTKYTKTVDKHD